MILFRSSFIAVSNEWKMKNNGNFAFKIVATMDITLFLQQFLNGLSYRQCFMPFLF